MIMRHRIRLFLADRSGAVAIEFAAIALPLMLMLVGAIEVSRYTWTRIALQDAASVGARCLGLRLVPCFVDEGIDQGATVKIVRQQAGRWGIAISDGSVTPEMSAACRNVTDFARIGIRHRFNSVLPVLADAWINVEACFPAPPPE